MFIPFLFVFFQKFIATNRTKSTETFPPVPFSSFSQKKEKKKTREKKKHGKNLAPLDFEIALTRKL